MSVINSSPLKIIMTKITYLGRDISGRYASKTRLQRIYASFIAKVTHTLRIGLVCAIVAWLMLGSLKFGIAYAHGTEMSYIAPVALADTTTPDYPILDKIANAESAGNQYCTKTLANNGWCSKSSIGAPLVRVNTNGTYDIGKYQINSTHLADAIAHGDDVYTLDGNTAYAVYLFMTQGSEPWYSSKNNWINK